MGLTHLLDTNICVAVIRQRAPRILAKLQRMTPGSVGVSIITVLTKPFPCPGECIYCPNEKIMPKSSKPFGQMPLSFKGLICVSSRTTSEISSWG